MSRRRQNLFAIIGPLNNRTSLVGRAYRNGWKTNAVLVVCLVFFVFAAWMGIRAKLAG